MSFTTLTNPHSLPWRVDISLCSLDRFNCPLTSLRGRRKKGRGDGGGLKGKGKGAPALRAYVFITPTNFLVIRLRLLSIKCRYTRQSERKAEPCGYAEIYLI